MHVALSSNSKPVSSKRINVKKYDSEFYSMTVKWMKDDKLK